MSPTAESACTAGYACKMSVCWQIVVPSVHCKLAHDQSSFATNYYNYYTEYITIASTDEVAYNLLPETSAWHDKVAVETW